MSLVGTMLESTATTKRPTIGRDSAQGVTQDPFVTLLTDVPCSCQQASARVQELYAQRNAFVTTTVYFAQDPQVQPNDLLLVTDRTGGTANYRVVGQSQAVGRGRLWNVDCEFVGAPS